MGQNRKFYLINVSLWLGIALALILTLALIGVRPAMAASTTWYVATTGNDTNDCATTSTPCPTINGAIGKATAGDTIEVAIGTYTASSGTEVVLIDKSLTLSGGWDATFTTQSDRSTIDGGGIHRGISINSSGIVVIDRFTIQNGKADMQGGGIYNSSTTMTINNSLVTGNRSNWMAAASLTFGVLTINNTTIRSNTAGTVGSGGGGGGGIENYSGTTTLNNSTISNNTLIGDFSGAGIDTFGTVILNNSTVSGNTKGEGIHTFVGIINLKNSTITGNQSNGVRSQAGQIILQNTIIAANGQGDCNNDREYSGSVASHGHNLIGNGDLCWVSPQQLVIWWVRAPNPLTPGSRHYRIMADQHSHKHCTGIVERSMQATRQRPMVWDMTVCLQINAVLHARSAAPATSALMKVLYQ